MGRGWTEPKLDDLLDDPILDVLLAYDRVSKYDLRQLVQQAREDLARVPRQWEIEPYPLRAANDDIV
jgi:hypothetical protein